MLHFGGVWEQITSAAVAAKVPASVAVAYAGDAAPSLLPLIAGSRLVVNASLSAVSAGATSPYALKTFLADGVNVFNHPSLHAKAYWFGDVGFVGSANASSNSRFNLCESVWRVGDATQLAILRNTIDELDAERMTLDDLNRLERLYKKPRISFMRDGVALPLLVMDIMWEQGPTRNSQVQPSLGIWRRFFGLEKVDLNKNPNFSMRNMADGRTYNRRVSGKDHNWTMELRGATHRMIVLIQKMDRSTYEYRLFSRRDPEYATLHFLLRDVNNPYRHPRETRRWVII